MVPPSRYWPAFEQVVRRQHLMDRMMHLSVVDVPNAVRVDGGLAFIEARAKCRFCTVEEACLLWLASDELRPPPDFCPNARFFRSCRRIVR